MASIRELSRDATMSADNITENANRCFLMLELIYLKSRDEKINIAIVIITAI